MQNMFFSKLSDWFQKKKSILEWAQRQKMQLLWEYVQAMGTAAIEIQNSKARREVARTGRREVAGAYQNTEFSCFFFEMFDKW